MKNSTKKPLVAALGAAFVTSMAFAPAAGADTNPFGATELETGYMVLAEGKCGEGKCGGTKKTEAKCGEGKCGADKAAAKAKEAKCAEGKCAAAKAAEKAAEAKCAEGKCAEGKCGS
jgi:uncharacterized low-complexity protein